MQSMRQIIKQKHDAGETQANIAKELGVSRQLVSRHILDYRQPTQHHKKLTHIRYLTCQYPDHTPNRSELKVHILNKDLPLKGDNLTLMCAECLGKLFSLSKADNLKTYTCHYCGLVGNKNVMKISGKYTACLPCLKKRREERATMWAPNLRLNICLNCKSDKFEHQGKGLCKSCYIKNLLKTNPVYRAGHLKACKNWLKNNEEMMRVYRRNYAKKYWQDNRKKLCEKARGYYRANPEKYRLANKKHYEKKKAEKRALLSHF